MHIHGNLMNVQAANPYSAAQGQQAAERAREVRKRLLESVDGGAGTEATDAADPQAQLLINQWLDSRHSQVLSGSELRDANAGRVSEFG